MDVKVTVQYDIVPDDGLPGMFWRNGERWDRTPHGEVYRLLDVAPNLEAKWMEEQVIADGIIARLKEKNLINKLGA